MVVITLVGGMWLSIFSGLIAAIMDRLSWLQYLYYLSYIKVGTTPIKYTPQVSYRPQAISLMISSRDNEMFITAPARSTKEGNVLNHVCQYVNGESYLQCDRAPTLTPSSSPISRKEDTPKRPPTTLTCGLTGRGSEGGVPPTGRLSCFSILKRLGLGLLPGNLEEISIIVL